MPNFAFSFCAQKTRDRDLQDVDLSSWRAVINCSEPVRWESIQAFSQRFAAYGLHPLAASTCYAMAENTFAVTQSALNEPVRMEAVDRDRLQLDKLAVPAGEQPAIEMVSTGKPIEQVQVKVVDAAGVSLPDRQVGEVAVRSHCMLTGYYNRPDATEKALAGDWYLTGDYGYLAEGELFITGRKKDLIIVGGKNIYPQDLEVLAMTVPGVHAGRVVVFGVMDEKAGTEEVYMVAEADEADAQQRELIADTLRKTVTQGSAVALRGVRIVDAGWIIKTSSGKTARSANRDKFLSELQSV
jgi:acyl-CoA synthetase (AMP-forming)/AMP-acid ligase II